MTTDGLSLEDQIERWRTFLQRRRAVESVDVAELEDHLREEIARLIDGGLSADEAFLVAVKRMGSLDALSREFAREHAERLWKQLVVAPSEPGEPRARARTDATTAFSFALVAALLIKVPSMFGLGLDDDAGFYARNIGLFVLPVLAGYFVWKRRLGPRTVGWLAFGFVAGAIAANVYPFASEGSTEALSALHLPIALWLLVGIAYAGGRWNQVSGRMDFIRFTGELLIYYVLIGLGGAVLMGFMAMLFSVIGLDVEPVLESWFLPCGAMGAVIVASWLVEAKQSVVENMAPVLTRLFTPMFTAVLLAFLAALVWSARGIDIERGELIAFNVLLLIVLGLLLYSISARDPSAPPGPFDVVQVVLVVSALVADAVALWAIAARISEFGWSPNRVAALGINVILLVNLTWAAVLSIRFLRGRGSFGDIERWQTGYLPVYAGWAALVVVVFPPLFAYA